MFETPDFCKRPGCLGSRACGSDLCPHHYKEQAMKVSDRKAEQCWQDATALGRKIDPQYSNCHDAPKWTEAVSDILAKLSHLDRLRLVALLVEGPVERPEA